jgi:crotonobetainyl-CoA:carnitine CoA-transferase CaiB-like acyl-CoA transferase
MQFIGPELMAGPDIEPDGNNVSHMTPHNAYPAQGDDTRNAIAAEDDSACAALADMMDRPELANDPRFAALASRKENEAALDALFLEWTKDQDKHALAARLQEAGVAASAVNTPADLARSDYLRHRGFFTELDHRVAGRHPHPGLPFHSESAAGSARSAAPGYGDDNLYVLRDVLALAEEEIAEILGSGAMATVPPPGV